VKVNTPNQTKRRTVAAAAATAVIGSAAASAALAEPAIAAHPSDTCPANTLCEWQHAGFQLPVKWWPIYPTRVDNYANYRYDSDRSVPLDNSISSIWNHTAYWVTVCNNPNCSTTGRDTEFGICLGPERAISNLNVPGSSWNDSLSAHRIGTAPDHCATYASQYGCSL
jgi:hypothetical protein